jgi:alpha-ketoglutarate-dependent taurine dioxygenase
MTAPTTLATLAPGPAPDAAAAAPSWLTIRPLTGSIGAEVRGVDLRRPLDAATVGALRAAWLRHKVVFLPGQHLEPADQVRVARAFGPLTRAHPVVPGPLPDHPEVLVLDAAADRARPEHAPAGARSRDEGWHSDVTFVANPPAGSLLSARVVPAAGGDTLWADTQAAYDSLDEPIRRLVDGLAAVHDGTATFRGYLDTGHRVEWDGKAFTRLDPVVHPIVRTHPDTGRRALFVNPQFTTHVVGLSARASVALLDLLYAHMTVPEHTVRHTWAAGDLAIWDNRTTMHYAALDYGDAPRVMHRVTLRADRPR